MTFLLDPNACIETMRKSRGESIRRRLSRCIPGEAVICSVVRAELLAGALQSRNLQANLR